MIKKRYRVYYVYACFKLNGTPCYIGKGKADRWKDHVKSTHNPFLKGIIRKSGQGLPIVIIHEGLTEPEAFEFEIALIKAIGRRDLGTGPLANLTAGGDGVIDSPTVREKRRIAMRGRKLSEATRRAISAANRRREYSAEMRARIGATTLGRKHSAETIAKIRAGNLGKHPLWKPWWERGYYVSSNQKVR